MSSRVFVCLVAVLAFAAVPAIAGNPNEAMGFPTDSVMIGGPGGDSISAYNGSLELGIPIGPTWKLPGMSWGLTLHYSSKVWRVQEGTSNDGTLARRGPFGVGWVMTMGRVFTPCREGCPPTNEMAYEDSSGTLHPFKLDPTSQTGSIIPGKTTDGTFMRVEQILEDPNSSNVLEYRIYPGNGLVLIFASQFGDFHSGGYWQSQDFYGFLLSRMEKHGPDPNVIESWVEVDYETTAALGHCIREIRDGVGSGTTVLRTVTFSNLSEHARVAGGTTAYDGGYTESITVPAVNGQTATTATYTFIYENLRDIEWDPQDPTGFGTHTDQLLLSRIELPSDSAWNGDYAYNFDYDPDKGEMTSRTLLTGAQIGYKYQTRSYNPTPVTPSVYLRDVVEKCLGDCNTSGALKWTYFRDQGNTSGPTRTMVTDPFGNQSLFSFFDSYESSGSPWLYGRTERIDHYTGSPLGASGTWIAPGGQNFDTTTTTYEYENVGTTLDPDIRTVEVSSNYPKAVTVRHSNPLPNGF
jgi:hypothetical protein